MNIKEALLQFLNEKSLGLSKQEIEKILHDELEKPESEIDCEIIDMCIELLAEIEHIPLPDDNIPVPPGSADRSSSQKEKALESRFAGGSYFRSFRFCDPFCLGSGFPF